MEVHRDLDSGVQGVLHACAQMSTPVGRGADARRPAVPKENLHAQSTGSTAGKAAAALRQRSNGHDSSLVQELTDQVPSPALLIQDEPFLNAIRWRRQPLQPLMECTAAQRPSAPGHVLKFSLDAYKPYLILDPLVL